MAGKISLGLSAVLAVAVAYLFFTRPSETQLEEQPMDTGMLTPSSGEGLKMAFIDEDTLLAQYNYILDKEPLIRKKLENRQKKLEQDVMYYQDQVAKFQQGQANYSESEIKIQVDAFAKMERQMEREQASLQQIELEFFDRVQKRILSYIEDYCDESDIDLMFTHRSGLSALLYRDGIYDATREVLEGLNDEYANEIEAGLE